MYSCLGLDMCATWLKNDRYSQRHYFEKVRQGMWLTVSLWLHLWGDNYAHYVILWKVYIRERGGWNFVIHTLVCLFLSTAQLDSTFAGLIQHFSLHSWKNHMVFYYGVCTSLYGVF
jgi:hypothetical protein